MPLLQSDHVSAPQLTLDLGNGQTLPLTQGEQISVRSPMNGQTSVNLAATPLLFVGYGVTAPERNWDDFKGQDVKGKLIVVLVNDPDFEGGEGQFGGKAMTYYGRWTYKYEEAARRGAAGVLIVHETEPAVLRLEHGQELQHQHDVRHRPPESGRRATRRSRAGSSGPLAEQIFAASGLNFEAAKAAAKRRDFQPVPLKANAERERSGEGRDDHLAQCRRSASRQEISRRDRHLQRPLGPSRHRQARRQGRHDLQWRRRQRDRHRHADRAGARLRSRSAPRPLGRLPGCHGRGKGPAR